MPRPVPIDLSRIALFAIPLGYRIRYKHTHAPEELALFAPNGAPPPNYMTTASLVNDETGETEAMAASYCNPADSPNKAFGRIIARNRVIKQYHKNDSTDRS